MKLLALLLLLLAACGEEPIALAVGEQTQSDSGVVPHSEPGPRACFFLDQRLYCVFIIDRDSDGGVAR